MQENYSMVSNRSSNKHQNCCTSYDMNRKMKVIERKRMKQEIVSVDY